MGKADVPCRYLHRYTQQCSRSQAEGIGNRNPNSVWLAAFTAQVDARLVARVRGDDHMGIEHTNGIWFVTHGDQRRTVGSNPHIRWIHHNRHRRWFDGDLCRQQGRTGVPNANRLGDATLTLLRNTGQRAKAQRRIGDLRARYDRPSHEDNCIVLRIFRNSGNRCATVKVGGDAISREVRVIP